MNINSSKRHLAVDSFADERDLVWSLPNNVAENGVHNREEDSIENCVCACLCKPLRDELIRWTHDGTK